MFFLKYFGWCEKYQINDNLESHHSFLIDWFHFQLKIVRQWLLLKAIHSSFQKNFWTHQPMSLLFENWECKYKSKSLYYGYSFPRRNQLPISLFDLLIFWLLWSDYRWYQMSQIAFIHISWSQQSWLEKMWGKYQVINFIVKEKVKIEFRVFWSPIREEDLSYLTFQTTFFDCDNKIYFCLFSKFLLWVASETTLKK